MSRENILAVDDEEDILELLRFNLAREGYQVTCAASGEDALRMAQTHGGHIAVASVAGKGSTFSIRNTLPS